MTEITTNEVLNVKLDYIKGDIIIIKNDVKEIKADYVTRREFESQTKDLEVRTVIKAEELDKKTDARFKVNEEKLDRLYSMVYWVIGLFGTATFVSLFKVVFK